MNARRFIGIWVIGGILFLSVASGLNALAPSSDLSEPFILEVPGNPKFRTYLVADPLYSLLTFGDRSGDGAALTVPHPQSPRSFNSFTKGIAILALVKLASKLHLSGAPELYALLEEGDIILMKASSILDPRRTELVIRLGYSENPLGRFPEEAIISIQIWHERLHLAIDRLLRANPGLWQDIADVIKRSKDRNIVAIHKNLRKFYGKSALEEEVFCFMIIGGISEPKGFFLIYKRIFSGDLLRKVMKLLRETMPTRDEVRAIRKAAERLHASVSSFSYYEYIRDLLRAAKEGRELSTNL